MKPAAAARLSLLVSLAVLALKYLAFRLTGSVSLYSDALESVVNVAAAGVALGAVWLAARPPDINHPYGHTKAEYFSAVAEGALILFAAVEIARAAVRRLAAPEVPEQLGLGVLVAGAASLINAAMAAHLIRTGNRQRSPALAADGRHLLTDVYTTAGVLAGIGLAHATGWWVLDPLLALVVAVNILLVGYRLLRDSVGGLMDESLSDAEMALIQQVIQKEMDGAIEAHALRSRHAGRFIFIEFHLVVPEQMTVADSHAICDRLEDALHEAVPGSTVTIHVEPGGKAKHLGPVARVGA